MDAVTYPEDSVVQFVKKYLTPLRIDITQSVDDKYQTFWTPTLSILNYSGLEIQKETGFFKPVELIASLHVGLAKVHIQEKQFDTAGVHLKQVLENFCDEKVVPEAIFFRGVNLYKLNDDPSFLKEAHYRLVEEYPESEWADKSYPYQFIS